MFVGIMLNRFQEKFLFYPTKLDKDLPYQFPWPHEEWFIETEPDIEINALYFKSEQSKGVVLYFHGNAGALDDWGFVAEDFLKRNYDLVIIDYRGYGKSTGQLSKENDFHTDASAFYDQLLETYKEDQIVLLGRSMGTGVAAKLAADRRPKALILETPYYSLESLIKHYAPVIPVSILKYKLPTFQWLAVADCPVHIIHGTNDEVIPYDNAVRLKEVNHPNLNFTTVPNAGHNNLSTFADYGNFLDQALN